MGFAEAAWASWLAPGWTAAMDLALGRVCSGCGAPGRVLCLMCERAFDGAIPPRRLPDGSTALSAAIYAGAARSVIIDWKEHAVRGLQPLLARRLALLLLSAYQPPLALVPIPAHLRSVRTREEDLVRGLGAASARWLRAWGCPARCLPLLHRVSDGGPHKSRSAAARRESVHGTFAAVGVLSVGRVIIIDDVVTTGATLGEAVRALNAGGIDVLGAATVAATPAQPG